MKYLTKNKTNLLTCIIISLTTALFLYVRFDMSNKQLTHYDDLFFPYILDIINTYESDKFVTQLYKYNILHDQSFRKDLINFFTTQPLLFSILKFLLGPIVVASTSTAAPLQFYFTSFFLNINSGYDNFLFSSRLPSLLFSLFSYLIFIYFSFKFKGILRIILFIFGTFLLSSSWMFIVYSTQSINYASTISSASVLFLILKSQKGDLSYKKFLFICLICVLLVFTHYQIFFLLPGFYFALFLREERKIQSLKKYKSKPPFLFFKKNGVYENLLNTKNHKEQLIAYYETMIRLKKML